MTPGSKLSSAVPFGRVLAPTTDDEVDVTAQAHVRILSWAASWSFHSFRLEVSHQGALFHFRLRKPPAGAFKDGEEGVGYPSSFCTSFWESVIPAFGPPPEPTSRVWYSRTKDGMVNAKRPILSDEAMEREDALIRLVQQQLPRLIVDLQQQREGSVSGSHVWVQIRDDQEFPDIARFDLVGDYFRTILYSVLRPIEDEEFPEIPRVDVSAIETYIRQPRDTVSFVYARLTATSAPIRLVFKTARLTEPPIDLDEAPPELVSEFADRQSTRHYMMYKELVDMAAAQSHPNVIPMPLALATITHTNADGSTEKRLIGWLQRPYVDWIVEKGIPGVQQGTPEDAKWRVRYAHDLVQAISFLATQKQYYHSDIAAHNTLLSAGPPEGRLMLIDFQDWNGYVNSDGPDAPEANGIWECELDEFGNTKYTHTGRSVKNRHNAFRNMYRDMPEVLERLMIFNVGTALARMLKCQCSFPWLELDDLNYRHGLFVKNGDRDAKQEAWEALIPESLLALSRRCCSYDPRDRPLVEELAHAFRNYIDGTKVENVAEDSTQSSGKSR